MKSQWGNCRMRSGRITLNTHLIKLPVNCIELVVAHELCHFLSSGHGKSFYQYLETVCPEWRFVAARLNGYQLRGSKT
jgi:predicted metal-dependent hydrolase